MPPIGDAVQERPTIEQEMAKFQGFSTTDGESSTGAQTPEETARLAADAKQGAQAGAAAAAGEERRRLADVLADPAEGEGEGDDSAAGDGADSEGGDGADSAAGDGADELAAEEAKSAKNKRKAKARVEAALSRATAAERERDALRQELAAERAAKRDPLTRQDDTSTSQGVADAAPDPSKFEYGELDPKYITALARHETKQELQAARAVDDKRRQDVAAEQAASEHVAKVSSFAEDGAAKYDDFNDVVMESAKAGEWDLTPVVGELMLGSVFGHDIAYYLATHPKEASRIAALSPAAQAASFGRMEAKLEAVAASRAGSPPVPKPSKAPPPVKTPRGPSGKYTVSAATEDFADFEKLAMAGR